MNDTYRVTIHTCARLPVIMHSVPEEDIENVRLELARAVEGNISSVSFNDSKIVVSAKAIQWYEIHKEFGF